MTGEDRDESSRRDDRDGAGSFLEELFSGDAEEMEPVIRPRREGEGSGPRRSLDGETSSR